MEKKDIQTLQDVQLLVDQFYDKIKIDPQLGGIFWGAIGEHWDQHLEKMYRFWQTILLKESTYEGSPFRPHASMPLQGIHFDRWLQLFTQTVDEFFEGQTAETAKLQANSMATMFLKRIEKKRESPDKFIQ